jgi:hypothetical protein
MKMLGVLDHALAGAIAALGHGDLLVIAAAGHAGGGWSPWPGPGH